MAQPVVMGRIDQHLVPNQQRPRQDVVERLVIGRSAPMAALRTIIRLVADNETSILITGPTGSGKEVVAQAIHAAGAHSGRDMVAINCAAIPADLIESELFGHERGSFTGATNQRIGQFEHAGASSLFLDEIGDLPLALQCRLLRVLEDRSFRRVGGNQTLQFRGRIICATHRDLPAAAEAREFREDLLHRLMVFPVMVPALADRREDIPELIAHFLAGSTAAPFFLPAAVARLMTHSWPGNVRELRNVVERAKILFPKREVDRDAAEHLLFFGQTVRRVDERHSAAPQHEPGLRGLMRDLERRQIVDALLASGGSISNAARQLTMNRTTLIEKMRRLDISRPADAQSLHRRCCDISKQH